MNVCGQGKAYVILFANN